MFWFWFWTEALRHAAGEVGEAPRGRAFIVRAADGKGRGAKLLKQRDMRETPAGEESLTAAHSYRYRVRMPQRSIRRRHALHSLSLL